MAPEEKIKSCPHCGNKEAFIGHGKDISGINPDGEPADIRQPYSRDNLGVLYHDQKGGHQLSECGDYYAIDCGKCHTQLFGPSND